MRCTEEVGWEFRFLQIHNLWKIVKSRQTKSRVFSNTVTADFHQLFLWCGMRGIGLLSQTSPMNEERLQVSTLVNHQTSFLLLSNKAYFVCGIRCCGLSCAFCHCFFQTMDCGLMVCFLSKITTFFIILVSNLLNNPFCVFEGDFCLNMDRNTKFPLKL